MEIHGEFIKISAEGAGSAGVQPGEYLFIQKNRGEAKAYIPIIEFYGLYAEAKRGISSLTQEPGVGTINQPPSGQENNIGPDFNKLMNYLSERIIIGESDFNKDNNQLLIESNFGDFIELPWEEIVSIDIFVLRKIVGGKETEVDMSSNNLMFVMSNAFLTPDKNLKDIKKKLKEEILSIYGLIDKSIENAPKYFKIDNIHISKHTTKDSFLKLPWDKYNYSHFIMHGKDNGELCLEHPELEKYKDVDTMSIEETLTILKDQAFVLLFLSFCYSGGGLNSGNSIAFQFAINGIAKYIIGYRYPVGDTSALAFAKYFYRALFSGFENGKSDRLELIYKRSLSDYYNDPDIEKGYIPLLYINA